MTQYLIGVLVGSLREDSFNRKLAHAMATLAPPDFTFEQVQIDDLPLYNQDQDDHPTPSRRAYEGGDQKVLWAAVRDTGIQPLDSRCVEECH
jgi:chromate reductase